MVGHGCDCCKVRMDDEGIMDSMKGMNSNFTKYLMSLCQHHGRPWGSRVTKVDIVFLAWRQILSIQVRITKAWYCFKFLKGLYHGMLESPGICPIPSLILAPYVFFIHGNSFKYNPCTSNLDVKTLLSFGFSKSIAKLPIQHSAQMPKKPFKWNMDKLNSWFSPSNLVLKHLGKFHHHSFSSLGWEYRILSPSTLKLSAFLQVLPLKCLPIPCLPPPVSTIHDPCVSTVIFCLLLDWSPSFHPRLYFPSQFPTQKPEKA